MYFILAYFTQRKHLYKQMNVRTIHRAAPIHLQIEGKLRQMIALKKYQQGALFPDEVRLAESFKVSRGTLRAALTRLVNKGLLERKAGVGTRVARVRPSESGIREWRSFSQEMEAKGIQVENFLQKYELVKPSREAEQALVLKADSLVYRLDRVRGCDGIPVLHSRSWFHPRLGLSGKEQFDRPLYELIASETGAKIGCAHEEFRAEIATPLMANLLHVEKGEPLLLRRHTVFDTENRPMEFAEVRYVSNRFTLTLDLKREM
jgi:GntR family transcriptional regulator